MAEEKEDVIPEDIPVVEEIILDSPVMDFDGGAVVDDEVLEGVAAPPVLIAPPPRRPHHHRRVGALRCHPVYEDIVAIGHDLAM